MNTKNFGAWVRDWLVLSASVMIAAWALDGISCDSLPTLLLVAATISVLNAFLRPLLILLSLPFLIATMGLGAIFILWLINSTILYFAGSLISGFHVASFGSAMCGAIFIGITQILLNVIFGFPQRQSFQANSQAETQPPPPRHRENPDDDVIDI